MLCHVCGFEVDADDPYCSDCGALLGVVSGSTELIQIGGASAISDDPHWGSDETQQVGGGWTSGELDAIFPLLISTTPMAGIFVPPLTTEEMPVVTVSDQSAPRFKFGLNTLIAFVTAVVAVIGIRATVVRVDSDVPITPSESDPTGFRTGTWIVADLAGNLTTAAVIAVLLIVAGAIGSAFGRRAFSGLAGGAGLALTGVCAIALGLAQLPIDAAHQFIKIPNSQSFTLTITRDLGYWLLLSSAALGLVLFFASLDAALGDRRSALNPVIAALGALAAIVTAGGPLLASSPAVFGDNWYLSSVPGSPPALLLLARLVQLGLLAVSGVVGFLVVRRWGLGLVIGGALPAIWMAASRLMSISVDPIGPGVFNPGSDDTQMHSVTMLGACTLIATVLLALIAASSKNASRPS